MITPLTKTNDLSIWNVEGCTKKGILIMEAQDSFIMRIFRKLWLVLEIEWSWNYVYTFSRREIQKVCKTLFLPNPKIKTFFYQYIPFLNNKVYPKLNWKFILNIYKFLLIIFNLFFWRGGNNFICYIEKK